jgi:hypothetical protein
MARDLKMTPSTEFAWVWVVNFPLFEWDEEEKRYSSTHHPFTAPLDADLAKLDSRDQAVVESIKSKAYDIVVNGSEVGGGSIRIHRMDVQQKVFSLLGIDDAAKSKNSASCWTPCLRRSAARRHRAGPGPPGHDPPRHQQHPRRDRLPQNPKRRRSDVRLAQPHAACQAGMIWVP